MSAPAPSSARPAARNSSYAEPALLAADEGVALTDAVAAVDGDLAPQLNTMLGGAAGWRLPAPGHSPSDTA